MRSFSEMWARSFALLSIQTLALVALLRLIGA